MSDTPRSQVTTGRGDTGQTSALSGEDLSKAHPIMESVGALDSLRAQLALLRLRLLEADEEANAVHADTLLWLLHACFVMGTECSDPACTKPGVRKAALGPEHLAKLEREQARLEAATRLPNQFIVSASNIIAAEADVAVTTARAFERRLVALAETYPTLAEDVLLAFVNRMNDYLFMLARTLDAGTYQAVDYGQLDC